MKKEQEVAPNVAAGFEMASQSDLGKGDAKPWGQHLDSVTGVLNAQDLC